MTILADSDGDGIGSFTLGVSRTIATLFFQSPMYTQGGRDCLMRQSRPFQDRWQITMVADSDGDGAGSFTLGVPPTLATLL